MEPTEERTNLSATIEFTVSHQNPYFERINQARSLERRNQHEGKERKEGRKTKHLFPSS